MAKRNPTPEKHIDNVSSVLLGRVPIGGGRVFDLGIFLDDGTFLNIYVRRSGGVISRNEEVIHVGIKLPQTIVFE